MKYQQIAEYERYIIYELLKEGLSLRKIAGRLNRSPSSISREIARNSGERGYRPKQAHNKSIDKKYILRKTTILTGKLLRLVKKYLKKYWSPEQISGRLKLMYDFNVSAITIYRFLAINKRVGGTLWKYLRRSNRKRKKKYGSLNSRGYIPHRKMISERPSVVEEKSRFGDWEMDTVVGANHKGVLVTLVERKSHFTLIGWCRRKSADSVTKKIVDLLTPYRMYVETITTDNGKEFAGHLEVEKRLDASVYFANPYSSWERGLNENTNGLIRQFFPKGCSLQKVAITKLQRTMKLLNNRPRKSHGYMTPNELFLKH